MPEQRRAVRHEEGRTATGDNRRNIGTEKEIAKKNNRYRILSFPDIYCGGYSSEGPPLPIPNREVKLTIADGTALTGGRVGSCRFCYKGTDENRFHPSPFFAIFADILILMSI